MTSPSLVYNPFTDNFDYAEQGGGGGSPYPGGVIAWTDVAGTSQPMAANNGYTANNAATVVLTLPATCGYGKVFRVVGKGTGGWQINQNAGQVIHFGILDSTVGVGGSIASTQQYDAIELLCTVANTDFTVINGPQGDLTVN